MLLLHQSSGKIILETFKLPELSHEESSAQMHLNWPVTMQMESSAQI